MLIGFWFMLAVDNLLAICRLLLLPQPPLPKPASSSIPLEMEVNIDVISSDAIKITNRKPNMARSHQKPKMAILDEGNVKTSQSATKSYMKGKTHRGFGEPKGESPKKHQQMKSAMRR
jgi:hypothetical protein